MELMSEARSQKTKVTNKYVARNLQVGSLRLIRFEDGSPTAEASSA